MDEIFCSLDIINHLLANCSERVVGLAMFCLCRSSVLKLRTTSFSAAPHRITGLFGHTCAPCRNKEYIIPVLNWLCF